MWLTDRSRYTAGLQECPRYRYLRYHAGEYGYGYQRQRSSIPLATGASIHAALAGILELSRNGSCGRVEARRAILSAVAAYIQQLKGWPLAGNISQAEMDWVALEQAHLIEALCWGWYRAMLPALLEEFEIVDIEREESLLIGPAITLMSRPDIILRRKEDGALGNHDFKSAASLSEGWIEEWRESVQMGAGSAGAAERLGEPINHFYMHALVKGSRGFFKKNKENIRDWRQVYSELCYAKVTPPSPPATTQTKWVLGGYWADKMPLWKADFTQKAPSISNAEFWAMEALTLPQLYAHYAMVGPYTIDSGALPRFKREMFGEESRWINKLWMLYESKLDWADPEFQEILDTEIPRSYKCTRYGSKCEMYGLCFFHEGWQDPTQAGYEFRKSHHAPENEQMVERGVPGEE